MAPPARQDTAELDRLLDDPRSGVHRGAARGGTITPARHPARRQPHRAAAAAPARAAAAPARAPSPSRTPPPAAPASPPAGRQDRLNTASVQGSGGLLALFAYPLFMNLLRGGPAQALGWVKAKFFNEPYGGAPGSQKGDTSGVGTPPGKIPGAGTGRQGGKKR